MSKEELAQVVVVRRLAEGKKCFMERSALCVYMGEGETL